MTAVTAKWSAVALVAFALVACRNQQQPEQEPLRPPVEETDETRFIDLARRLYPASNNFAVEGVVCDSWNPRRCMVAVVHIWSAQRWVVVGVVQDGTPRLETVVATGFSR